jgi:hypothetical protein
MTRIENGGSQERQNIRKEIREELRGEDRRKGMVKFGGCLLTLLIFIGIPTAFVAVEAAKTGLVTVPLLTPMLFKEEGPSRVVMPLVGAKPEQVMQIAFARYSYDAATSLLTVPIREEEMTTVFRDAIDHAPPNTLPFPMKDVQLLVDDDDVEMFAHVSRAGHESSLRVRFHPVVVGGQLTTLVRLGNLTLPHWMGSAITGTVGRAFITSFEANLSTFGKLEKVLLQKGTLKLVLKPKPK